TSRTGGATGSAATAATGLTGGHAADQPEDLIALANPARVRAGGRGQQRRPEVARNLDRVGAAPPVDWRREGQPLRDARPDQVAHAGIASADAMHALVDALEVDHHVRHRPPLDRRIVRAIGLVLYGSGVGLANALADAVDLLQRLLQRAVALALLLVVLLQ